jgi:hypothetical protein
MARAVIHFGKAGGAMLEAAAIVQGYHSAGQTSGTAATDGLVPFRE